MNRTESRRVLMISARSDIGGGPAHMYQLADGLAHTVQISAALPSDGYFYGEFQSLIGAENVFEIPRQKFTIKALLELRKFCQQKKIELIHSHGKGAGVYSRLLGLLLRVPIAHTLHGYHDGRYTSWLKRVYAWWETCAGFLTQKIICVSASEALLFKEKVWVSEQKLTVIPNGTQIQANVVAGSLCNKVVTVARFDYQKNLIEFLRIAQQLPKHDFYVIGDGVDRTEIESFLVKYKINNVTLCGVSHRVLEDITNADVYLTTARWEGLPLAVLEAMSLGIPVVASDVVGNRDAVKEGVTGYLYPLGNVELAVDAIRKAPSLNRALVREYHREHFSSDRMVSQTLQLYRQVAGG